MDTITGFFFAFHKSKVKQNQQKQTKRKKDPKGKEKPKIVCTDKPCGCICGMVSSKTVQLTSLDKKKKSVMLHMYMYKRARGLDLRVEPYLIKLCRAPPPTAPSSQFV